MRYFKNPTNNEVYGYDETYENDLPYIEVAIKAGWEEVTDSWPPSPSIDVPASEPKALIDPIEKLKQFLAENPDVAAILK